MTVPLVDWRGMCGDKKNGGDSETDGRVIGFPRILEIAPFAPSSAGGKPLPFMRHCTLGDFWKRLK